jgi:hypothetical protein
MNYRSHHRKDIEPVESKVDLYKSRLAVLSVGIKIHCDGNKKREGNPAKEQKANNPGRGRGKKALS